MYEITMYFVIISYVRTVVVESLHSLIKPIYITVRLSSNNSNNSHLMGGIGYWYKNHHDVWFCNESTKTFLKMTAGPKKENKKPQTKQEKQTNPST